MLENIFYGAWLGRDRLSLARVAYLLLIWLLVPMWLVVRFYTMILGLLFTAGLGMVTDGAGVDASFRRPFFTWTGDIGLHDLRIQSDADQPVQHSIQIRRLLIDMPNWGVMEQAMGAFDSSTLSDEETEKNNLAFIDKIDHVGLSIEGMQANLGRDLPNLLQNFGLASAAPFEAEGCERDGTWIGAELEVMGIKAQGVDLRFTLSTDATAGEVHVLGRLESPHSSRVDFAQHFKARSFSAFLEKEAGDRISTYERIEVTDAGFIGTRDIFCAKRDGIAKDEFTERHIAAIQRRLQAKGLHAGDDVERVYRNYLVNGSLLIEANPSANVRRADYRHYSVADQQRMYNGRISSGDKQPVPLVLEAKASKSIPLSFTGSTWDLMVRESLDPAVLGTAGASAVSPGQGAGVAPAAMTARAVPVSMTTSVPAQVAAPPTASVAAAAPAARASTPPARAPTPAPTPTPTPTPAPAPAPAPAKPRRASSLPTAVARREIKSLTYEDVGNHIGERLLITTIYGQKREGKVEDYSTQQIGLRVSVGAGYAIQHIERKQIRSIRDLD
ncbi:MAG: hypothetical protein WC213_03710 [Arenimonas sp.]|jgi:hypothetical protein